MRFPNALLGYLAILFCIVFFMTWGMGSIIDPADLVHQPDYCTLYCEYYGCTHPRHLTGLFQGTQLQVKGLKALPIDYELVNVLVYVVGYSMLAFWLFIRLFDKPNEQPKRQTWLGFIWRAIMALLLLALVLLHIVGKMYQSLFQGCAKFCVIWANGLGMSLYDFYSLTFVVLMPGLLLLLILANAVRYTYKALRAAPLRS
ncbi:hypothetical protein GCM10027578_16060 [Spirosoma luteolum]